MSHDGNQVEKRIAQSRCPEDGEDGAAVAVPTSPRAASVHQGSRDLLECVPFLGSVPILGLILKAYHPRLVVAVGLERLLAKGLAHGFMRLSIQPMLTGRYGLTGAMYQRLSSLYALGWSVNSFFTAFADTFALLGYTRRWYAVICALGGGAFALLYGLMPAKESSAKPGAAFMFMTALFLANVDTFAEAIYSRRIRSSPATGAAMVSWSWAAAKLGALVAAAVQGPLSDNNLTNVGVYITGGILFFLSILFIFNIFEEQTNRSARIEDAKTEFLFLKRAEEATRSSAEPLCEERGKALVKEDAGNEEEEEEELAGFEEPTVKSVLWGAVEFNKEVVKRNWAMIIYSCVMTAAVVATAVVTILGTHWDLMYACIAVTVVICVAAFFALPLVIAKVAIFDYFFNIFYLNLPGVLNTFYVAKPACLPDGPHFNYTFYNIMNGIIGNVGSIIGIAFFAHYFQNFSYRAIMGSSAIIIPVISIFDLIMVKRWNLYIGIPDHAMYIFGDAIVFETVDMLMRMPTFLLLSRVAPRGSEAMVLAILQSYTHLGQSTSSAIGYLLLETIWPVKTKGKCDYSNAPWLVITGHIVVPLLILPLSFLLLPASRVCATLDSRGNEVEEIYVHPASDTSTESSLVDSSERTSNESRHSSRFSAGDPFMHRPRDPTDDPENDAKASR